MDGKKIAQILIELYADQLGVKVTELVLEEVTP